MNRSWTLDAKDGDAWRTYGQAGVVRERDAPKPFSPAGIAVERNGTIHMRVTVDNGYPWSYHSDYRVMVNGLEVARGVLDAPARGTGVAEFDVPAHYAFDTLAPATPEAPAPKSAMASLSLEVALKDTSLYAFVQVTEASA